MSDKKRIFNFYLNDDLRVKCSDKLERLCGEKSKGQLASLIRVLLYQFAATPDDRILPELLAAIDAEYEYSAKKNKRSRL